MDGFGSTEQGNLRCALERPWGVRYASALLSSAVALTLSLMIQPLAGVSAFLLFFAAVLAAAQFGGLGPAVLAIVLAILALDYFFLPPVYSIGTSVTDALGVGVFVWLAILVHSLHVRQIRLVQAAARTDEEFRVAARIQQRLLPGTPPRLAGFDIAATCHPCSATGGDFFDYIAFPDECWGIAIGDVSSHGFGPALLMAETHAVLRTLALAERDVGQMLTAANRLLCDDTADGQFVTVFLGRLNPRQCSFEYAAAGHEGYLLEASGLSAKLPSTGLPLGILESTIMPTGRSVVLQPGQCVILVTDGFVESQDRGGCCFGIDRVLQIAQAHLHQSARQIIEAMFGEVERFNGGAPANDDRTAVVIKAEGCGPSHRCQSARSCLGKARLKPGDYDRA